ncbi:MAG: F0F1 ATP synthase subunit B [Clostridia bacterium]|nr:F0F1 ATP synthase subunit B [Clostridia bacterium]
MQSLEVISVNVWSILISLCNLLILTLLVKKFLFKRIMNVLDTRKAAIDADYSAAAAEREQAEEANRNYQAAMAGARQTADQMIADAARTAERRGNEIVLEARDKAADIRKQAEADAALEKKKAEEDIRHEIAEVSAQLTGKLLEREINADDHRGLIDSFLQNMGNEQ